jgi:hypothetical protein
VRKTENLTTIQCRCHEIWEPSSSSSGPGTYAPDAPQPVGLMCYPCTALVFFRCSHISLPVRRLVRATGETPSSERWNYLGQNNGRWFCQNVDFHVSFRDLYMPQIYDMGPTALLPLRRKACWGVFRPEKSWRLRPGLNPRTWVLKSRTLPLDHRSRLGALTSWNPLGHSRPVTGLLYLNRGNNMRIGTEMKLKPIIFCLARSIISGSIWSRMYSY